ncbi:hypothetical protein L3X38_012254 [Prunus dulcis]|uniref:Transposable element protein n=1 Tax=Prunus dulcis TaxID=3755 RepID=A0AAD4ZF22_PRUDU|nr:hypothetical protein L3X38_012254 [Prunus dulcis]
MREEIEALHAQGTWDLFPLPAHKNPVDWLQISYQATGLFVSHTKYIKELLDKVDLQDSKPYATPCLPYHRLLKDDGKPYSHPEQYRSIVRALQYLIFTRPGITFSVNQACQFIHNPMESHVMAVKRILRYLKGTIDFGIHFQHGLLNLQTYSDDDWAVDPNDRRSVLGCIVYLVSSPISWASKKQHTISRSSTEAEYRALAIVTAELAWIRQLFCDYHVSLHIPPLIHCDNIYAISLSSNPIFHSIMKHLEIDYHFVREQVIRGDLLVNMYLLQTSLLTFSLRRVFLLSVPATLFQSYAWLLQACD